jgi:hypothetical protein
VDVRIVMKTFLATGYIILTSLIIGCGSQPYQRTDEDRAFEKLVLEKKTDLEDPYNLIRHKGLTFTDVLGEYDKRDWEVNFPHPTKVKANIPLYHQAEFIQGPLKGQIVPLNELIRRLHKKIPSRRIYSPGEEELAWHTVMDGL